MPDKHDWFAYVRSHLRLTGLQEAREAEIVEDVARQLEDAYREALASGATESDARVKAERHITDWDALARELSASPRLRKQGFDRWSDRIDDRAAARGRFTAFTRLWADVRYAVRLMVKTPGFSALAVLMLALGTGANAAVFSVVDGVMVRSPFGRRGEIASVHVVAPNGRMTSAVAPEVFARLAPLSHVVVAAADIAISSPVVTKVDVPRRGQVECVPASMTNVLGVTPLMGRWFSPEEDTPAGPPVVVVSYAFWQVTLNGDPGVLGRRIVLDDAPVEIIGVMRKGFDGPWSRINRDIWAPLGQVTLARALYGCQRRDTVNGFVRLKPGLTTDDGAAAMNAALGPVAVKDGQGRLRLFSIFENTHSDIQPMFVALSGAVIAVLLIACANVANLGLARLVGRRREIAVRLALGATRGRILRQTVTEQLVVAVAGAAVGIVIAALTFDAMVALLPRSLPQKAFIALNGRVLATSIGVTLLVALVVGLIPAFQASSVGLRRGLSDNDRGSTPGARRLRWTLVIGELALGVMLLVGALLMIRTFLTLRPDAPGFDPTNKLVSIVRLPTQTTVDERLQFVAEVSRHLKDVPGVADVANSSQYPMSGSAAFGPITVDDKSGEAFSARISANYLDVMRIPVLRGRGIVESDGPGAPPVALASEAFVARLLSGREPLDAVVTVGVGPMASVKRRIVGVVGDTRFAGSDTRARPYLYVPFTQDTPSSTYFIVGGRPAAFVGLPATMRQVVARLRPGQLVDNIDRFENLLAAQVAYPRLGAWLLGIFGGLAVLLAAVGLGTTLAWSVAERRREIGVRMALGAAPGRIRGLILRQTFWLAGTAIVIGLTAAVFASRLIEGWIYGVARTDVMTYAACGAGMLAVALVAAYIPARRASRVDPLATLRAD